MILNITLNYQKSLLSLSINVKTIFEKPVLQEINYPKWRDKNLAICVLREDLVHPFISGNKWRKLKYNIDDFYSSGKKYLLTFGGAYSNHLIATAAFAFENKINAIGIVRGEIVENDYMNFVRKNEMKLHFISREDYRNKTSQEFITGLLNKLVNHNIIDDANEVFILPEGGSNAFAVKGTREIMNDIPETCNYIACACGTGATIAGISKNLLPHQNVIGVAVLKANGYFEKEITRLNGDLKKIILNNDHHFGGYAKKNKSLLYFCNDFTLKTKIPLEPVYTGKLFYAIDDLIKKDYFKKGDKVTLIHTGGIFF